MASTTHKPRLAVISPFLDKRHGTERRAVEWISRLADSFEVHVYSQRVEDLDLSPITWHRIPKVGGPHLINYVWWFTANHLWRAWDRRFRGLRHDLTFSPGINCLDADAISVHIVFAQYVRNLRDQLRLAKNPVSAWPRLLHRKLYYSLIVALERRIYSREDIPLILISRRIGEQLGEFYGRGANDPVVYLGLDHSVFNPERRLALRDRTRAELGIAKERFVLLLIGNDRRNKGFPAVMGALARVRDLPIDLLLVSSEDTAPVYEMAAAQNLRDRVRCLPPRSDVEQYYAAADMYTGPSLEDAFAQPPAEAMACGLPVIVSSTNGVSEIITDGVDGFIMRDAHDEDELASTIRRLWEHRELRAQIGHAASVVVQRYTWEQNAAQLLAIFQNVLLRKAHLQADTLTQEL